VSGPAELQQWLEAQGFVSDPELAQTGERFTDFLASFRPGQPQPAPSAFDVATSGPVILRELPFYSLCAHHLLPFFGTADVLYVPSQRVVGLGGVPSLLRHFAHQPQLQERLGEQLAQALQDLLAPRGLLIRLSARQMCMEMRGAESAGLVQTFASRGDDQALFGLL